MDFYIPNDAPTRRQMLASIASGASVVMAATQTGNAATAPAAYLSIHQEIDFNVSPSRVYEALVDERQFSAFTGGVARIDRKAGGEFTLFGHVTGIKGAGGRIVEIVPNQRIVQAWRALEWPDGVYSIVRIELTAYGPGTRLVFDQAGLAPIPPTGAWSHMYWEPLRKYLES